MIIYYIAKHIFKMSVTIEIPKKHIKLTRDLTFEEFKQAKRELWNTSCHVALTCEHQSPVTTAHAHVFATDGENIWYDEYKKCKLCMSSRLNIWVCGGVSFIVYTTDGETIKFDEQWGQQEIVVSYVPDVALKLWTDLSSNPSDVQQFHNLIAYYSSESYHLILIK